jgi:hypothetical protein
MVIMQSIVEDIFPLSSQTIASHASLSPVNMWIADAEKSTGSMVFFIYIWALINDQAW